jgi:serine phosphatase RsbU (regulator of sigma subunit)
MIGGDFIGIRQLDADRYGFILADVMGHGVAAALYTMYLSALWGRFSQDLIRPSEFALNLNRELCKIVKDESFATAVCGVVDISRRIVKITSAGGPPILMFSADGNIEQIDATGCPFGMIDYAGYDESEYLYSSGDRLLAFSDGAIELQDAREDMLGAEGLVRILKSLSYPESGINIEALQRELLTYSNEIRLDDDLTLLEIRFS